MARTVAAMRPEGARQGPARGAHPDRSGSCSFCTTTTPEGVRHDYCRGEIHTTAPGRKDNKTWTCQCWLEGHQI